MEIPANSRRLNYCKYEYEARLTDFVVATHELEHKAGAQKDMS
jgi:hypothetical protein